MVTHFADTETRREERISVDLKQPVTLAVHNPNGDVVVRAAERGDVLVGYVLHGPSEAIDLTIDSHENNRIEVTAHPLPGIGWSGFHGEFDLDAIFGQITRAFRQGGPWSPGTLGKSRAAWGGQAWCDITIEVPRTIAGRLDVHSASGDVRIEGVPCESSLKSMSGDVRVLESAGELSLQSASGDLTVERSRGRLTAHTASGDVRVTAAQLDEWHIQTASGDVTVDALLTGDNAYRAQSASGDIRLTLRQPRAQGQEPSASLAFQTVSGDAHVSPPFRKTDRRRWQAGAGEGGPRIEVTTVSGDLSAGIAAVGGPQAQAPAPSPAFVPPADETPRTPTPPAATIAGVPMSPPAAAAPPEAPRTAGETDRPEPTTDVAAAQTTARHDAARLAVLEAVERGEIDIEEALARLEAADGTAEA